ncbi:MAG: hypothetical protein KC925_01205 [Candidatus Doudnabacteria bacterium]|nr:hypothetical protein [Candidatus Doudnabacteria bacterium]
MKFLTVTTTVGPVDVSTEICAGIEVVGDRIGPMRAFEDCRHPMDAGHSLPVGHRDRDALLSMQDLAVFRADAGSIVLRTERVPVILRGSLPVGHNGPLVGTERDQDDSHVLVMWQLLSRTRGTTGFFPPTSGGGLWAPDSDAKSERGIRAFMQVLVVLESDVPFTVIAMTDSRRAEIAIMLTPRGEIEVARN